MAQAGMRGYPEPYHGPESGSSPAGRNVSAVTARGAGGGGAQGRCRCRRAPRCPAERCCGWRPPWGAALRALRSCCVPAPGCAPSPPAVPRRARTAQPPLAGLPEGARSRHPQHTLLRAALPAASRWLHEVAGALVVHQHACPPLLHCRTPAAPGPYSSRTHRKSSGSCVGFIQDRGSRRPRNQSCPLALLVGTLCVLPTDCIPRVVPSLDALYSELLLTCRACTLSGLQSLN